jgi:hypothetical protein
MDALLGFSAFHLGVSRTWDLGMSQISQNYMVRAIRGHACEIKEGINEKNAEAAFATSTFIALHASFSRRFLDPTIGPPLHWFHPFQGCKAILESGWEWIAKSEAHQVLRDRELVCFRSYDAEDMTEFWNPLPLDFLLEGLEKEFLDAEIIECYELSVSRLNWIYKHRANSCMIRFAAMTGPIFTKLLSENDPRILTIVGYFFMCMEKVYTAEWIRDLAECEFRVVMELLPTEWWPRMELAMKEFQKKTWPVEYPSDNMPFTDENALDAGLMRDADHYVQQFAMNLGCEAGWWGSL